MNLYEQRIQLLRGQLVLLKNSPTEQEVQQAVQELCAVTDWTVEEIAGALYHYVSTGRSFEQACERIREVSHK